MGNSHWVVRCNHFAPSRSHQRVYRRTRTSEARTSWRKLRGTRTTRWRRCWARAERQCRKTWSACCRRWSKRERNERWRGRRWRRGWTWTKTDKLSTRSIGPRTSIGDRIWSFVTRPVHLKCTVQICFCCCCCYCCFGLSRAPYCLPCWKRERFMGYWFGVRGIFGEVKVYK